MPVVRDKNVSLLRDHAVMLEGKEQASVGFLFIKLFVHGSSFCNIRLKSKDSVIIYQNSARKKGKECSIIALSKKERRSYHGKVA